MGFPTAKVHRPSRRHLTKGQQPQASGVQVAVTSTGTTNVTLTFNRPVVVTGTIGVTVATLTLVSQTVVSNTVVTQVWSGNVATHAFVVPAGDPHVGTYQGGPVLGSTGTFP
jgi:hypothetical protein